MARNAGRASNHRKLWLLGPLPDCGARTYRHAVLLFQPDDAADDGAVFAQETESWRNYRQWSAP